MSPVDPRALRIAADAYRAARQESAAAEAAAQAAYERLQASPTTIEYQSDWIAARREEAAAASRLNRAQDSYRAAGGYMSDTDQ